MPPKTSRDISGSEPRKDREREQQDAVIKDADKTGQKDWDNVHGDGGEIVLDDKYLVVVHGHFRRSPFRRQQLTLRSSR